MKIQAMVDHIKKHKFSTLLVLIIIYLIWKSSTPGVSPLPVFKSTSNREIGYTDMAMGAPAGMETSSFGASRPVKSEAPPQTNSGNRLVVQDSNLSLVVKDVRQTVKQILETANQAGGYMVSSNINRPQETPFATVVVRIPADNLQQTLDQYRGMAIKVTSENLRGHDVTDQYVDINTRLSRLRRTQAKFEDLLDKAVKFQDILTAQREILNLQDQIDNLIGQQQYLEQNAKLAKVTIYLSSDELALPYAPDTNFRPAIVFKLAVRSLLKTLQSLATKAIWLAVYSVIWVPALVGIYLLYRWKKKRMA